MKKNYQAFKQLKLTDWRFAQPQRRQQHPAESAPFPDQADVGTAEVIAVLALVRGKWEIPLLLAVFALWGL